MYRNLTNCSELYEKQNTVLVVHYISNAFIHLESV